MDIPGGSPPGKEQEKDLPENQQRAFNLAGRVNWGRLLGIARDKRGVSCSLAKESPCSASDLYRGIIFTDNVVWLARLRLPVPRSFNQVQAYEYRRAMQAELTMTNYLKEKTQIPVQEIFVADLDLNNPVGAPYFLLAHDPGWRAHNMVEGIAENEKFMMQMASIQAQLSVLRFGRIGSVYPKDGDNSKVQIGPDIMTGLGPWDTAFSYYSAIAQRCLSGAGGGSSVSSGLPQRLLEYIVVNGKGIDALQFGLAHRDFGAHVVMVDEEWNITALLDLDKIVAMPREVIAQFPWYMGYLWPAPDQLYRKVPGRMETADAKWLVAELRKEMPQRHNVALVGGPSLHSKYVECVRAVQCETTTGWIQVKDLAENLLSVASEAARCLLIYGIYHYPSEPNKYELAICEKVLSREAPEGGTSMRSRIG